MNCRPLVLLISLCSLAVVFMAFYLDGISNDGAKSQRDLPVDLSARMESRDPSLAVVDEAKARNLSPRGWIPPKVFSVSGTRVAIRPFSRGVHENRRYHSPKTFKIFPVSETTPAVLARLPEDKRTHLLPEEIDQNTLIGRRLAFDPASLEAVIAGETSEILAPSVDQEILSLSIKAVKSRSSGTHTLQGTVKGEEDSSKVQFVYHDGVVHGNVVRYETGQEIEYRILSDGYMMVRELDQASMNSPCGNTRLALDQVASGSAAQDQTGLRLAEDEPSEIIEDTSGFRTLDLVVGYGQDARVADGGISQIEARIISSVDRMNASFVNSQIGNAEVMLLGTIEDPDYRFGGAVSGMEEELDDLNNFSNGPLDTVTDYGNQLGADFFAFIIRQADEYAGIAYSPGRASVTSRTYMTGTSITFAHELGHNLGCDHSWGDSEQTYKDDYGWRLDPPNATRVRTIMAYDSGWGNGARIPHFANPDVLYLGARTGAVAGYNATGDATVDQRYVKGGRGGYDGHDSNRSGFDGTNPALAATNANTIDTGGGNSSYGIQRAANRSVRTDFEVIEPSAGAGWLPGTPQRIFFTGGDTEDVATLQLFKGGVFQTQIAANLDPATDRAFSWDVPDNIPSANDYTVRVVLTRNGSTLNADSGEFTIFTANPLIIAQSPAAEAIVVDRLEQVQLTFSRQMNPSSFSVNADVISFTAPGGGNLKPSITGANWSSNNTVLTLNVLPQDESGSYRLTLAPTILSSQGDLLDQDQDGNPGETNDDQYRATIVISSLKDALDIGGLTFVTSGNQTWFPQAVTTHDGVDAAQSGDITDDQTSSIQTTVTGPGILNFWWKVSSEIEYDFLEFYLNDQIQTGSLGRISGDVDWVQKSVSIPSGVQVIRWTYRKDKSESRLSDTAWLDEVSYDGQQTPTYPVAYNANGATSGSAPANQEKESGRQLNLASNTNNLKKNGFSFIGWNTSANGSGLDYAEGASYTDDAPLTLFARWNSLPVVSAGENRSVSLSGTLSWSPLNIEPKAWYDASDSSTRVLSEGKVSEWRDKSGNNRHATQELVNSRPEVTASGMNGRDVLTFDEDDKFFRVGLNYLAGTSHSAFFVLKSDNYTDLYGAANPSAGARSLHVGFRDSSSYRMNYWGDDWHGVASSNFAANQANILNYAWMTGLRKEVFANGSSEGFLPNAGTIGTMSGGGRIGKVVNRASFDGDLAEIVFFTEIMSKENREKMEGYLAHKWGLLTRLPNGHPYRNSPPGGAEVTLSLAGVINDPEGNTMTASWSLVSGPGAVSFGDSSSPTSSVTLSAVGTYVLSLTVSDGFGSRSQNVTITVGEANPYAEWTGGAFTETFTEVNPEQNQDGDSYPNLLEFALGLDPTTAMTRPLAFVQGGSLQQAGAPQAMNFGIQGQNEDYRAVFTRRKNYQAAGLTYTLEFSADLDRWTNGSSTPKILTGPSNLAEVDVVSVPFPASVPLNSGGSGSPLYFRVSVSSP